LETLPCYDIVPAPKVAVERRDLALEVGKYGRAASLYDLFSQCEAFELDKDEARAIVESMLVVVRAWREFRGSAVVAAVNSHGPTCAS
jgi:hypothetical protein